MEANEMSTGTYVNIQVTVTFVKAKLSVWNDHAYWADKPLMPNLTRSITQP